MLGSLVGYGVEQTVSGGRGDMTARDKNVDPDCVDVTRNQCRRANAIARVSEEAENVVIHYHFSSIYGTTYPH